MEKLKVLVVDDEPGIRSGVQRVLKNYTVGFPFMDEDFSFEVMDAETGESALNMITHHEIDIILLDNKLPGIQGIEVLEKINKMSLDIAVMMITSYASLEIAVKATTLGAYNFIPKPFTPDEVKSAIENISKHLFLMRMTRKMKEEGRQIRFRFLSVLSHELKSPLNAVEGYLEIMKEKQAGENITEYMSMIDRSLVRIKAMRGLIMDMLDLTRLESGKKSRKLQNVNLNYLARMAVDTVMPLAIQSNIEIITNLEDEVQLTADPDEMEIIFNNLLSNAVKYNRKNGEVQFEVKQKGNNLMIRVSDTGIGIDQEDLPKLFAEFSRIKTNETQNINGSGLGLSIVKKMVDLYRGTIDVSSQPRLGTTFKITLPII
ncbi:MAG: hybrid sensor histidine kinase/response regulator [Bacteroidales bacterium]|nr:hybrid sensor histidine kinase/response regulator [Bacteroidales bacterium]